MFNINSIININDSINIRRQLKFIDLFCGIGGFHQAMVRIDAKCVFACDIDEKCRQVYNNNYKLMPHSDITKVVVEDIPNFDVLCAGFPCQSFSNSGNKKGLSDKRGMLFEYILKIATIKKPLFMFLENVKHIKKIDNGKIFDFILKRINETGYYIDNQNVIEISPHNLGIPQQRERIIFNCIRKDIYKDAINIPIPNIPISFENILEKNTDIKYKISSEDEEILTIWDKMLQNIEVNENLSPTILCNEFNNNYNEVDFADLPKWKQDYINKNKNIYNKYKSYWDEWYNKYKSIINKKEIYGKLEWQSGIKKENDSIFNYFIQFRQSGIRVKKTKYFPTLVAIVQTPIYAKEKRYITPRECARLQSFPDTFIMHETDRIAYKQFGNAVNVDVVHFVISNVLTQYKYI